MQRLVFFIIAMMAVAAQAQVIRCTNPKTGQVTYSDRQCDSGHSGALVERRKSHEEVMSDRVLAAEANEQKYRRRLAEMEIQRQAGQQAPAVAQQSPPDKSTSYECRQSRKDHETVSSIRTGTAEERRNRINSSTVTVNATCGLSTELVQPPARPVIIDNRPAGRPSHITRCDAGFCYDNFGGVYHRSGPGFMTGPNGRTCHGSGAAWTCN